MMRYKLTTPSRQVVQVSLDAKGPDEVAPIRYEGAEIQVWYVQENLQRSHGIDGHLIEDQTTPVDLDVAMKSPRMQNYAPQLLEGAEILAKYVRNPHP